jgi:hypothetical protein
VSLNSQAAAATHDKASCSLLSARRRDLRHTFNPHTTHDNRAVFYLVPATYGTVLFAEMIAGARQGRRPVPKVESFDAGAKRRPSIEPPA